MEHRVTEAWNGRKIMLENGGEGKEKERNFLK